MEPTCSTSNGIKLKIINAEIVDDVKCELRHIGKVIFIKQGKPTIICGKWANFKLKEAYEIKDNKVVNFLPIKSFRVKFT